MPVNGVDWPLYNFVAKVSSQNHSVYIRSLFILSPVYRSLWYIVATYSGISFSSHSPNARESKIKRHQKAVELSINLACPSNLHFVRIPIRGYLYCFCCDLMKIRLWLRLGKIRCYINIIDYTRSANGMLLSLTTGLSACHVEQPTSKSRSTQPSILPSILP